MGFMLVVMQLLFPIPKYTSFPNLVFLEDSTGVLFGGWLVAEW